MENYISYNSVNIQAQPCFATLHILAEKKYITGNGSCMIY